MELSPPPDAPTHDSFLDGRLKVWQPRHGYRAAIDPVLLAASVPARPGQMALELGCGVGTALLCLGRRVPGLDLHGVEIQPDYADLARRNTAENAIPAVIHTADLRAQPAGLRAMTFDHVMMNPPFMQENSGRPASGRDRDTANREQDGLPLAAWIDAGLRRLRQGGRLVVIHRPDRLAEILAAIGSRAGGIEILPLAPREGRPATRLLLRARKGSRTPLVLLPALTLHEGRSHLRDGDDYTEKARCILRHMSAIEYTDLLQNARSGGKDV